MSDHTYISPHDKPPWWVNKSYLGPAGFTSKHPCPWCGRTKFVIAYWTWVSNTEGVRNICKECGDTRWEMQELGRIVGVGE